MTRVPARSTVFTNANLFDAESSTIRAHTTVSSRATGSPPSAQAAASPFRATRR